MEKQERLALVEKLFHAALALEPGRRAAFLDSSCASDPKLRAEVESLLSMHERPGDFLNSPAYEVGASLLGEPQASSLIGKSLGHYQILDSIGAGGMGEVFRARDTHLDRSVAVKVLPAEAVANLERKRRFVQEAKSASALNHPNIVHIYDIDKADGVDFIAMEYIAGKTLGQLIRRKGLGLGKTLAYAAQIADALAAAHAAGIVHRDLKPANIMVTEKGLVKVLDFGLAKLVESASGSETATTQTVEPVTDEGVIVGTLSYMSPEQAEGKKIDARSDIFSFGSVLYEMITGRRAFEGDTKVSTLSAIVSKEPEPLGADIPQDLEKIVTRCLRKDPERRFQHIADVKVALEELKEDSESGKLHAPTLPRARILPWAIPALVVLVLAVAGVTWWLTRQPEITPAPQAPVLTRLTTDSGLTTDPALSSDGKLLTYASDRSGDGNLDIYVKQVGGGEPLRLTRDPADEHEPAFSPDGTKIAFRSEREEGGIYMVSALGGPARMIAPEGRRPQFSPDGNWIAYYGGNRIYIVASAGGVPRQLQSDFFTASYPIWSPDGKHVLFLGDRENKLAERNSDWWVAPLDSVPAIRTGALEIAGRERLSGPMQSSTWLLIPSAWEPGRDSIIFSARSGDSTSLWRIGISTKTWKVSGPPQRLTSGLTLEESPSAVQGPGGVTRVAFASLSEQVDVFRLPIDANRGKVVGDLQRLTNDAGADIHATLSRDDSRMVFISNRTGSQEIWIKDLRSGEESPLTASRSDKYLPIFSPDGSKVSFSSLENKKWNIYLMPAAGGAPEMVCEDCGEAVDWTSDGKYIVGNTLSGVVWLLEVASRRTTEVSDSGWPGRFSPDERWIILNTLSRGTCIVPFQRGARADKNSWVEIPDGNWAAWSPDGASVYGTSGRDGYTGIWAQRLDPTTKRPTGSPFAIFPSHNARRSYGNVADNGIFLTCGKIVFGMGERTGNIWMAEFKR